MAPGLPRTSFNSSRLLQVLAERAIVRAAERVGGADSKHSFAEGLGQWLDWTDAIALSSALNSSAAPKLPQQAAAALLATAAATAAAIDEVARVRSSLTRAISADAEPTDPPGTRRQAASASAPDDGVVDFSSHRRRHAAHQREMEAAIAPLRSQLRAAVSGLSPALHRLAALDAVFDRALAARERHLLASLATLLERHFNRLRQPQAETPGLAPHWLAVFCSDMQSLLLAELDLRMNPIEGLLAAIPNPPPRPS